MTPFGGLGCNTQVLDGTQLYVGGSTTTVDQAVLAVHGVYIAWGSDEQPASGSFVITSSTSTNPRITSASAPAPVGYTTIVTSTSARSTSATFASSTSILPSDLQPSPPASTVTVITSHVPTNPSSSSQGLSTGAKAGIGVGASIGGVAAVAAVAWFIFSRRKKRTEESPSDSQLPMYDDRKEHAMETKFPHISELSSDARRSELMGAVPWMETQSKDSRAELEGWSDLELRN